MQHITISDKTFDYVAMNSYIAPIITVQEFNEDLNRFRYLKKLCSRYRSNGEIKVRLLLNHIIILYNVFSPPEICTKMIMFKLSEYLDIIKPCLLLLSYWNEDKIEGIEGFNNLYGYDIKMDNTIVKNLREEFNGMRIL